MSKLTDKLPSKERPVGQYMQSRAMAVTKAAADHAGDRELSAHLNCTLGGTLAVNWCVYKKSVLEGSGCPACYFAG